jgi:DNA adenine methylase
MPKEYDRYIEPFMGSACLFFAAMPPKAILSDKNSNLIEAYRTIAKHPIRVLNIAKSISSSASSYYNIRDNLPESESRINRAAHFIYLNRFCFNALYRTNKKGHFNVPFGSRTGDFPSEDAFRDAAKFLGKATLLCSDFQNTVRKARRGDFIYLDPPYVTSKRMDRNEYGPDSFSVCDIPRLLTSLEELHDKGARFLLSYCACTDLLQALPRKVTKRVQVQRHIAATPSKRRVASELLIDNEDVFGAYP